MSTGITLVIPTIDGDFRKTIESIDAGTCMPDDVIVIKDKNRKGANWARNEGFKYVNTEFVLFSDDDIEWMPRGIEHLVNALDKNKKASYAYGTYEMGGKVYCNQSFSASLLKKKNYISTMSLIRTNDFCGFDENIKRLQDWDLWLTMLEQKKYGTHCGRLIFKTDVRNGITFGGINWEEAVNELKKKHKI